MADFPKTFLQAFGLCVESFINAIPLQKHKRGKSFYASQLRDQRFTTDIKVKRAVPVLFTCTDKPFRTEALTRLDECICIPNYKIWKFPPLPFVRALRKLISLDMI